MGIQVGEQLQLVMVPGSQVWDHIFGTVSFMWNLCSVLKYWVMVDEFWHPIFKWAALPCTLWWVTRMIIPVRGDMLFNKRFIEQVYQFLKSVAKLQTFLKMTSKMFEVSFLCIDEMGLIIWFFVIILQNLFRSCSWRSVSFCNVND